MTFHLFRVVLVAGSVTYKELLLFSFTQNMIKPMLALITVNPTHGLMFGLHHRGSFDMTNEMSIQLL